MLLHRHSTPYRVCFLVAHLLHHALIDVLMLLANNRLIASCAVKMYDPVSGICLLKCGFSDYTKVARVVQVQSTPLSPSAHSVYSTTEASPVQVWCAITFMTNIRQRPVAARLVQLSGNLGIAKRATKAACWAAVEGRALPSQHAKAFQDGQAKLELVEL